MTRKHVAGSRAQQHARISKEFASEDLRPRRLFSRALTANRRNDDKTRDYARRNRERNRFSVELCLEYTARTSNLPSTITTRR